MKNEKNTTTETLYTKMRTCAQSHSGRIAVSFYGKKLSYGKMLKLIDCCAGGLKELGVLAGDVVTVCMPNTPSAIIAFYAINKIGGVVNLMHPYSTPVQLKKSMQQTRSKRLIAYDLFISKNESELDGISVICSDNEEFMGAAGKVYYKVTTKEKISIDVLKFKNLLKSRKSARDGHYSFSDEDPAVYLASGGTTGEPKTIMHNCRAFNDLAGLAQTFLSEDISKYPAMYSVLPIFHGFGLCMNMHLCMINGITNVMSIKFDPAHMVKSIKKEKVSVLTGVPAMYSRLLDHRAFQKADLSMIKECFVGGDLAPERLINDFNRLLKKQGSNGALYTGYGLTETVTVCAVTSKKHNRAKSVGYPLPGTKVSIIKNNKVLKTGELGEICIATPIMMMGYLDCKENPVKDFEGEKWLFTGDYGYVDEAGFLYFKQRIKNTIKVNGIPVFPSEVEEVIEKVDGVKKVAAVGVKDSYRGEIVKVYIEPEIGANIDKIKKDLAELCAKELIVYAQPKAIEFRDKLPLNTIGKIDRAKL